MSTESQIQANRENAKLSCGPRSEAGKAASALNHLRHGLAGAFRVLPTESQDEFDQLLASLREEHQPFTFTETLLVEAMAEHQWLRQRALNLEPSCYDPATGQITNEKQLALYLRYQTTHERAFHKALHDLLKLRAEKRKERIGFESQQRAREEHERKQAENERKQEKHDMRKDIHKWDVMLAEVKVECERGRRELQETEQFLAVDRAQRVTKRA
jgi:hypothetical protein